MAERKKVILFKLFSVISLLPILLWPFVFYSSIFIFDAPDSMERAQGIFFLVNAYPLYLIGNMVLSHIIYNRNKTIAYLLLSWPVIVFSYLVIMVLWG